MFGGTRRFLALVALCTLTGCTGTTSEPERAQPPTTAAATSTSSSSTTTSTTEPADTLVEFEPLLADPALSTEEQIEAAYLFHWEVLLDAYQRGDVQALPLVYVGEALATRTAEIERLSGDGHQVRGTVVHNYAITVMTDDLGVVIDAMTNDLERVNRETGEVIDPATSDPILIEFRVRKAEGQWLVEHVSQLTSAS